VELSDFEKDRLVRMQENCVEADGMWRDGECKTGTCFDSDSFEGEDDKYIDGYIQFISKNAVSHRIADRCMSVEGKSKVKEMTCVEEGDGSGYFVDSFIEYDCENGCKSGVCKRLPYLVDGADIQHVMTRFYNTSDIMSLDGGEIDFLNTGILQYKLGDNDRYNRSIISEEEYKEVYGMILNNDDLFIALEDYDELFDEYKDIGEEDMADNVYTMTYSYYPEGVEKSIENLKLKGVICYVDCPQELADIVNRIKEVTPDYSPEREYWYPKASCDQCDDEEDAESCWNKCLKSLDNNYDF